MRDVLTAQSRGRVGRERTLSERTSSTHIGRQIYERMFLKDYTIIGSTGCTATITAYLPGTTTVSLHTTVELYIHERTPVQQ